MLTEKDDIRIFILYLMRNVGYPLSYLDLHDVVTQNGFVSSFDAVPIIDDLTDHGNLKRTIVDKTEYYEITEQGALVADELSSRLLNMIREKALRSALRFLDFKRKGTELVCEAKSNLDSTWEVQCGLLDKKNVTMMITLHVDNDNTKNRIIRHFSERPEETYRGILSFLTGKMNFLFDDMED